MKILSSQAQSLIHEQSSFFLSVDSVLFGKGKGMKPPPSPSPRPLHPPMYIEGLITKGFNCDVRQFSLSWNIHGL